MKKIFKTIMFIFVFCNFIMLNNYFFVKAFENENLYSYTYNGVTYYSEESEDDAWYQAMIDNYQNGILTEEQIENEYALFSTRNIEKNVYIYENYTNENEEKLMYLYGHLTWKTSSGYELPLKNVRVDIYNSNLIGSSKLGTTYTDLNGNYYFEFINDDSWLENSGYDLFIRCYSESYTYHVARDWVFDFLTGYYFQTKLNENVINVISGTTIELNATIEYDINNMVNCSFYISQALEVAQRFALEMGMETDDTMDVDFPYNDVTEPFCWEGFSGVPKNYFNNFDTLMHEYGHFVEYVMGTYGSTINDIILYDPSHFTDTDHFEDKNDKQFAMHLTWSESWATSFAQIAQDRYLDEYYGKVNGYGDIKDVKNYEQYTSTSNSCEAQEDAVIASLWDLYDEGTNESYDNMSLTYQKWWEITTRDNIKTLTDLFEVVNLNYPEYRSIIGEIFGAHQISPSNLLITNLNDISTNISPEFTWKVNGSINNPNNQFKLVFYDMDDTLVYQTEKFNSSLYHLNDFSYTLDLNEWRIILDNFSNSVELNIVVQGFHSETPISGPYNSKYCTISLNLYSHQCNYTYSYSSYNSSKHKAFCSCGEYTLKSHVINSTATGRYKPCIDCGYLTDGFKDVVIVGPNAITDDLLTSNYNFINNGNAITVNNQQLEFDKKKQGKIIE